MAETHLVQGLQGVENLDAHFSYFLFEFRGFREITILHVDEPFFVKITATVGHQQLSPILLDAVGKTHQLGQGNFTIT